MPFNRKNPTEGSAHIFSEDEIAKIETDFDKKNSRIRNQAIVLDQIFEAEQFSAQRFERMQQYVSSEIKLRIIS